MVVISRQGPLRGPRPALKTSGTAPGESPCFITTVLEIVGRIAGSAIDEDAPLGPENGIDSLGALELHNELQVAAATLMPSTIVFDHPTARQLTEVLSPAPLAGPKAAAKASALAGSQEETSQRLSRERECGAILHGSGALLPARATYCSVACGYDAVVQVPSSRWVIHSPHREQVAATIKQLQSCHIAA